MRRRWATVFGQFLPVNLHKEVAMIPRHVARHEGWEATLAFTQIDEVAIHDEDCEREVRVERLGASRSRLGRLAKLARFLWREAPVIDVLQLYHLTPDTMALSWLYALRNRDGVCFVKLDMDERAVEPLTSGGDGLKQRAVFFLASRAPIDFFTIETSRLHRAVAPVFARWRKDIHPVPSGFSVSDADVDVAAVRAEKEPLLLYVGHIGMPQKNVALLLDALELIPAEAMQDWRILLAGELRPGQTTPCITERLETLRRRRPDISERLELTGHISDRRAVFDLLRRARVLCLPSRWESFGLVLAEAAAFGCSVVSTEVGAAPDITAEGRDGWLVPSEDAPAFAAALREAMDGGPDADRKAIGARARLEREFDWMGVASKLILLVDDRRAGRMVPSRMTSPGSEEYVAPETP